MSMDADSHPPTWAIIYQSQSANYSISKPSVVSSASPNGAALSADQWSLEA